MQFWLRHGFGEVSGVDLNDFSATWKIAIPILEAEYTAKISVKLPQWKTYLTSLVVET